MLKIFMLGLVLSIFSYSVGFKELQIDGNSTEILEKLKERRVYPRIGDNVDYYMPYLKDMPKSTKASYRDIIEGFNKTFTISFIRERNKIKEITAKIHYPSRDKKLFYTDANMFIDLFKNKYNYLKEDNGQIFFKKEDVSIVISRYFSATSSELNPIIYSLEVKMKKIEKNKVNKIKKKVNIKKNINNAFN